VLENSKESLPYDNSKEFVPLEYNKNVNFCKIFNCFVSYSSLFVCSSSSEPTWVKVELPPLSPVAPLQEPVAEISAEQRNQEEKARYRTFSKIRMNVVSSIVYHITCMLILTCYLTEKRFRCISELLL
jgi:hypothetical protein